MSIKIIDLTNFQLVHTESAQGSSIDISNKAGMDRVVKETTNKLLNSSMNKLITYNQNVTEKTNSVYSLELTGFQSLSSANRFIKILTKNDNVESCEVVDFSNKTLFAEIKFKNKANYTETLEKDNDLLEMFLVSVKSVTNNKIVGDVIIR
jgi:predicted membrane-bound mannosyltransferase